LFSRCGAVYRCPHPNYNDPILTAWDKDGTAIVTCSDVYVWCWHFGTGEGRPGTPAVISKKGIGDAPLEETVSYLYTETVHARDAYTGAITNTTVTQYKEEVRYSKVLVVATGEIRYTGGSLTHYWFHNAQWSMVNPNAFYLASQGHWSYDDLFAVFQQTDCICPRVNGERDSFDLPAAMAGNVSRSGVSICCTGDQFGGGCSDRDYVFFDEPPQVIGEYKKYDNELERGEIVFVPTSFNLTFYRLYGIFDETKQMTLETKMTTPQVVLFVTYAGKTYFPVAGVQVMNETYLKPIWNRIFVWDRGSSVGGGYYERAVYSDPMINPLRTHKEYRGFAPEHQSYTCLQVLADADGYATGGLLVDIVLPGAVADFRSTTWIPANGKYRKTYYALQKETTICTYYDMGHEGEDDFATDEEVVMKYITRVIVLEADMENGRYINARKIEDYEEVIEFDPPDPNATCYNNADIRRTLWYKFCATFNPPFYPYCGYVFFPTGSGDTQIWSILYNGRLVYSTPPPQGFWEIDQCCAAGKMLAISEVRYELGNNRDPDDPGNTHQYRVFIEGNDVFTGAVTPLNEREPITVFDCCGTHWDNVRWNHRYAMLGTGDFIEEADMPMTLSELQEKLEENEEFQEPPVMLTDGTAAERFYEDDTPTEYFVTPDEPEVKFIPNEVLVQKTITDTRLCRLFHNGNQIGSNKRYDGLYCCGGYALCTYVDDDYLSGWKDERENGDTIETDRKWCPHPDWGDSQPPAAKDREQWDYYRSVYPGFAVDVFYEGMHAGTFKLSDPNSPIHFDRLGTGAIWLLRAVRDSLIRHSLGNVPWSLEGAPQCNDGKLLIPYNGGLTTIIGNVLERRVFV
jgi:hypothetical protein